MLSAVAVRVTDGLEDLRDIARPLEAADARTGEIRLSLAAGKSVRAMARARPYGLATVQRVRSAAEMRGPAAEASVSGPESGAEAVL